MEYRLQLNDILDQTGADHILRWLRVIPGVNAVEANAGASHVRVLYDGDLVSPREIGATAVHSGYALKERDGGCCGACGGAQAGA